MHRFSPALALALLTFAVLPAAAASAADPVLDAEEKAFCKQINQYRAQNGRPALRVSVSLTNASKWMSKDMATKNSFSHTDSLGRSFSTRLCAFGYSFNTEQLKKKGIAEPKCWSDLTKPEFKDEIQVANPNSSGTSYTMLATLVQLMGER